MDKRTTEKEKIPFLLVACQIVVALQRTGIVYSCPDCRDRFVCRLARALQFIRKDCKQPVCTCIPLGEQPARLRCRTGGQLCLLRNGRVDEKPADIYHCRAHLYYNRCIGVAQRTDLLQHHLSGGDDTRLLVPLLVITDYHRYGQMQRLRTVFAKMQGGVHQRKGAHCGLQPLRGVHGLHRYVPARSHQPLPNPPPWGGDSIQR